MKSGRAASSSPNQRAKAGSWFTRERMEDFVIVAGAGGGRPCRRRGDDGPGVDPLGRIDRHGTNSRSCTVLVPQPPPAHAQRRRRMGGADSGRAGRRDRIDWCHGRRPIGARSSEKRRNGRHVQSWPGWRWTRVYAAGRRSSIEAMLKDIDGVLRRGAPTD